MSDPALYESRAGVPIAVVSATLAIATIAVSLRTYVRAVMIKQLGMDDWAAMLALILAMGSGIMVATNTLNGHGRHFAVVMHEDPTGETIIRYFRVSPPSGLSVMDTETDKAMPDILHLDRAVQRLADGDQARLLVPVLSRARDQEDAQRDPGRPVVCRPVVDLAAARRHLYLQPDRQVLAARRVGDVHPQPALLVHQRGRQHRDRRGHLHDPAPGAGRAETAQDAEADVDWGV